MTIRTLILSSVAAAALAGAAPAYAFTHHPGTPAEHQQTEDLNQQQLQQTQSGTSSAAQSVPDQTMASNTQTSSSQQTQAMPDQTASNVQSSQPMQTASAADPSSSTSSTPAEATAPSNQTSQPVNAMTPVSALANTPQTLANASVESSNGQAVGAVQRVITDASGKAKTVVIALLGKASHVVAIAANELTFDQSRNVVVADLSADQINSLPMAPQG